MTEYALELQKAQLIKNLNELKKLHSLTDGIEPIGSHPELVAKAIREGIPIPLKYTHSYQGLQALFNLSLINQDTQLYVWTVEQIKLLLSPSVLEKFIKEKPAGTKLPVPEETPRRAFLKSLKKPTALALYSITTRCDKESYWGQQINRFLNANRQLWYLDPSTRNHFHSISDILQFSFVNENKIKRGTPLHPYVVINNYHVTPLVYIPSLIEALAPKEQWEAMINEEFFLKQGLVSKKCPIDRQLMESKLKYHHAPDYVLQSLP